MNKNIIIAFVSGVFVAGFAYQVYVNWQFHKIFNQDHETLSQVVKFLNENTKPAEPAK